MGTVTYLRLLDNENMAVKNRLALGVRRGYLPPRGEQDVSISRSLPAMSRQS